MRRVAARGLALGLIMAMRTAAHGSEVEDLRAENARLRARVAELEAARDTHPGGPLAAALEDRAAAEVQVERGDGTRATTVTTRPSQLELTGGAPARSWFTLRAAGPAGGAPPEKIDLVLDIRASAARVRDARTLRSVADGTSYDCAVVGYGAEAITAARSAGPVGARENVTVTVPRTTLHALAAAREVRGSIGPLAFRLTPEQLAVVRGFEQQLERAFPVDK